MKIRLRLPILALPIFLLVFCPGGIILEPVSAQTHSPAPAVDPFAVEKTLRHAPVMFIENAGQFGFQRLSGHCRSLPIDIQRYVDGFVGKLNLSGSSLVYSSFLTTTAHYYDVGGTTGTAIAVDNAGIAYVSGQTACTQFYVTGGTKCS
jgi:hypothetical protein